MRLNYATRHALGCTVFPEVRKKKDVRKVKLAISLISKFDRLIRDVNQKRILCNAYKDISKRKTSRGAIREEASIRERRDHGERPTGSGLTGTPRARVCARYQL